MKRGSPCQKVKRTELACSGCSTDKNCPLQSTELSLSNIAVRYHSRLKSFRRKEFSVVVVHKDIDRLNDGKGVSAGKKRTVCCVGENRLLSDG